MYSTCLHCHHSLGQNDVIEHFPVGRRLAFDAHKGRLWVVCAHCQRWNLTPIEERWEAVEECEREFRSQRLRAQTDNVGLARLADHTELIRIGKPLRPEFAAWRYGGVFRRRLQRRVALTTGIGTAVIGAGVLAGGAGVASAMSPILLLPVMQFVLFTLASRRNLLGTKVVGQDGKRLDVTQANLDHTKLIADADGPMRLQLRHSYGRQELTGDRATRALSTLLARVNGGGGLSGTIMDATELIAESGDPRRTIAAIAREAERRTGNFEERSAEFARAPRGKTVGQLLRDNMRRQSANGEWWNNMTPTNPGALTRLPGVYRLALEMSLHESSEQFALEQELATLERDWREAEEIAAIADNFFPAK
jgi:hypothetical protein